MLTAYLARRMKTAKLLFSPPAGAARFGSLERQAQRRIMAKLRRLQRWKD